MDPFTAIGLAGNIVAFVDIGFKLLSKAKEIHSSASGASSDNENLDSMTRRLQEVTSRLQEPIGDLKSIEQKALQQLALECHELSGDLLQLLQELKAKNPKSKRESLRIAFRGMRLKSAKEDLERRLNRCREQLNFELSTMSRYLAQSLIVLPRTDNKARFESLERLNKIVEHSQSSDDELASLMRSVQSLHSGGKVSYLSPEALEQIRKVLDLSEQAVVKVREGRVLDALKFDIIDERFEDVEDAHVNTFDWIFVDDHHKGDADSRVRSRARDSFIEWLEQGQGIFHVAGKPGSGKSTLMKFLCRRGETEQHLKAWADDKELALGKFFFWRPGSDLQKTLKGLIRGLLYCLLSHCRDLISTAFPEQWEASIHRDKVSINNQEIWKAFDTIISTPAAKKKHKFAFFIDGLDEYEGNHADLIRRLFGWTGADKDVKICVSSREWTIFQLAFKSCPKMTLHELTRPDILTFTQDRLKEDQFEAMLAQISSDTKPVEEAIVEKSDGVFLWVSLVLRQLEEGLYNGDRMKDIQRKIDSLPSDLEKTFQHLFDSIQPVDRKLAYAILAMATRFSRGLTNIRLVRYSFLEDYLDDPNFAAKAPVQLMPTHEIVPRLERTRRQLYGICKGFLELRSAKEVHSREQERGTMLGDIVKFTHRSIIEFLNGSSVQRAMGDELLGIDLFDAQCQTLLGQVKSAVSKTDSDYYTGNWDFHRELQPTDGAFFGRDIAGIARLAVEKGPSASAHFHIFLHNITAAVADLDFHAYITLWDYGTDGWKIQTVNARLPSAIDIATTLFGWQIRPIRRHPEFSGSQIRLWMLMGRFANMLWNKKFAESIYSFTILEQYLENGHSLDEEQPGTSIPCWHFFLWTQFLMTPFLPAVAMFLYYGGNPRFWLNFYPELYKAEGNGIFLKPYFESGTKSPGPDGQELGSTDCFKDGRYFPTKVTPTELEIIRQHKSRLSLGDLVGIWFPTHGERLQQVIDWILDQGAVLSDEKRAELKEHFGPFLKPLYQQEAFRNTTLRSCTVEFPAYTVNRDLPKLKETSE